MGLCETKGCEGYFLYRYYIVKREREWDHIQFYLFYYFSKVLCVLLLFLKTGENNFYLFSKNYSLLHFVFKIRFPKNIGQTVLGIFKNSFLFF